MNENWNVRIDGNFKTPVDIFTSVETYKKYFMTLAIQWKMFAENYVILA